MTAACSLVLLLAQAPADHGPEAGPRAAIAGLSGFQCVSKIDFGARQNRLTAVYVFPDRARWHFESYAAVQRSEHQFFYRTGEHVRTLDSGRPSQELTGDACTTALLQMELRRAVLLWPDGFAWEPAGEDARRATVRLDSCCPGSDIGTLLATLENGRPRRIEVRDLEGSAREALEITAWQELHGRTWPRTLALEAEGGGFVETIESIETRVHYLELSFVPPDLRPLPAASAPGPELLARDLVAMSYAVHPLEEGLDWERALEEARRQIEAAGQALKPAGLVVDPVPTFEVSAEGRPVRCLVRLGAAVRPAPAGFLTRDERPGLFFALQEVQQVDATLLQRLARAAPEGARAGTPYVRIHARPNLPVEIVLPLEPGE